jgi:hypothetical protein
MLIIGHKEAVHMANRVFYVTLYTRVPMRGEPSKMTRGKGGVIESVCSQLIEKEIDIREMSEGGRKERMEARNNSSKFGESRLMSFRNDFSTSYSIP